MEADRLVASLGRIDVIHRPGKLGLGSAYKQAFQTVLRTTGAEFICQMDADFSHRPVDLRSVLEAACRGVADIVVGSRWIPEVLCPIGRSGGSSCRASVISTRG